MDGGRLDEIKQYENIVYSEQKLVKFEIIFNFFNIARLIEAAEVRPNPRLLEQIAAKLMNVYIMIRSKQALAKDKIEGLEALLRAGKPLPPQFETLKKVFVLLQEKLDALKLTEITNKELNPDFAYLH